MKKKLCLVFVILVIFSLGNLFEKYQIMCIDTDGNLEEQQYKRGYVQDANGIYWDQCMNGNKLIERICKEDHVKNVIYECEMGCFLGACKKYNLFKLPDFGFLPISQNIFSFQKTEQKLDSNLEDINQRLLKVEKELGLVEKPTKYYLRISAVNSLESGEIFNVEYFSVDKEWNQVKKENSNNIDLEIFVLNEEFEGLVKSFNLNNVDLTNFNIKKIVFSEKGKELN